MFHKKVKKDETTRQKGVIILRKGTRKGNRTDYLRCYIRTKLPILVISVGYLL